MKSFIRGFLLMLAMGIVLAASSYAGTTSTDLSIAGVGARPLGMGKAFTAVADDSNALFLNAAGLAGQEQWEMTSLNTRLLNNVDYKMVGGVIPTSFGTFGIGYIGVGSPAGYTTQTEMVGGVQQIIPVSEITYRKEAIYLSYGRKLNDDISLGATLKNQKQNFDGGTSAQAGAYDADLSLLWKINPGLSLGLSAVNALSYAGEQVNWSTGQQEKNQSSLKLGGAYQPNSRLLLALDSEFEPGRMLWHAGAEYRPFDFISVRMGLDQNPLATGSGGAVANSLTAGVGLKFFGVKFDYAYYRDAEIGDNSTHYFSMSVFGQDEPAAKKAEPRFNPRYKNVVMDAPVVARQATPFSQVKIIACDYREVDD
ncbi:MAG: hypothetical protein PHH14_07150 [Candidatus Margulisbacteria bacterium]|nr:hypothetical protein [Candidatus Margulisiibacteriota bacterium]